MKPVMARGKSLKWSHRPTSFLRAQFFSRYRKPPAPGSFGNIAVGNASWARGAAIYSSSLADYTWFSAVDMRRLHNGGFGCRKDCALVGRGRNLPSTPLEGILCLRIDGNHPAGNLVPNSENANQSRVDSGDHCFVIFLHTTHFGFLMKKLQVISQRKALGRHRMEGFSF